METDRSKLMKESKDTALRNLMQDMANNHKKGMDVKRMVKKYATKIPKIHYDYQYRFLKCGKCGREMLVETLLFGIDHTAGIIISCKECLKKNPLPEDFMKKYPEEAKAIVAWLNKE